MKWFFLLAALGVARGGDVAHPELADIKTVYLLPMTYSLDQFLAIRLTRGGVMQVVTDPKLADAIISDHIGAGLEESLQKLYGEKKVEPPKDDKDADGKDKVKEPAAFNGPVAGGARSKGAVFLLDRKTRSVLWSDYVPPKSAQAADLNRVADKIATQLEKDKKGK
ncbi:MAG: hypothetical protein ABSF22_03545 [Bryobacteraceae bacterium]|jgi:hypothetical protein